MRRARIISLSLRVTEYSSPRRMFFATCCVIVEPPWRLPENVCGAADVVRDKAPEVADTVRAKAPEVADQVRDQASGFAGVVRDTAPVVAARVRDRAATAREQALVSAAMVSEPTASDTTVVRRIRG